MPKHNADIAAVFEEIGDLLEIQGANPFRIRAYRNAARVVGELSQEISRLLEKGEDLTELPGIGDDLAGPDLAEAVSAGSRVHRAAVRTATLMPTVLITGANRGLGLGLARVYLENGWQVIAAVRRSSAELEALQNGSLDIRQLDLWNDHELAALARSLGDRPIDVLINNAGRRPGRGARGWAVSTALHGARCSTSTCSPRCACPNCSWTTWKEVGAAAS